MENAIISCFPGCGKTYLYLNNETPFRIIDFESTPFSIHTDWPENYVNAIISNTNNYDMIFISQHEEVLQLLKKRKYPFFVVSPNNSNNISLKKKKLIKQQWFGRFLLRNNNHINKTIGFDKWLNLLIDNYEDWTSIEHLKKYVPIKIYLLDENEYISDIVYEIYKDMRSF